VAAEVIAPTRIGPAKSDVEASSVDTANTHRTAARLGNLVVRQKMPVPVKETH
jgi:hypothetical protein